ncbi:quinone-dependent dihydroorotate dehydrogenase [Sphingorhabdus sp. EL138]|uniref:quinone-dependent dihydroorotate dehydrogenase n=1 Tax=Sphingorhabdus sp. EL138 TaxID=2073156 RepID=UPI000D69E283|nr:quinone-dependent dihydroorotate dehydrogenase [Sphingorhabdus sp. EL138]
MSSSYKLIRPLLFSLPQESAHNLAINVLKYGLVKKAPPPDTILRTNLAGLNLPSPLGMAAGFDKNAVAFSGLFRIGFGFVEVGTLTPKPQLGNPKPRLFRLKEDEALINRLGFNNIGICSALRNLTSYQKGAQILGVNIGANKDSEDRIGDYIKSIDTLGLIPDYLVINISSPNTPALRELQFANNFEQLLERLSDARDRVRGPIFIKIAPDLSEQEIDHIARLTVKSRIDGLIVANTTINRPEALLSRHSLEVGGLSGRPLSTHSINLLKTFRQKIGNSMPLISSGGINDAQSVYERIRAGANAVQLYTALIYKGPSLPTDINTELVHILQKDGFSNIMQAVGVDS